jgi:hypothetical protein
LIEAGTIDKIRPGVIRLANVDSTEIDIDSVDLNSPPIDISLPFGLERFVVLYPKNIIVYAGSTDAGKSALAIDTLWLNRNSSIPRSYFNSEMGPEELRKRFDAKDSTKWWNFRPLERDRDFAAAIRPNHINVIDYIELTSEFYKVSEELKGITAKLKRGVAIVCLQKKAGAEMAFGADATMWKARLYVTIDYDRENKLNILRVKKAKNPRIPGVNIKDWEWKFRIHDGVNIEVLDEPLGINVCEGNH